MNNPYRNLPPLGTLVGFEAAARLGGFSSAAEELNVTQSAISHQIRTLEAHLGQPLFLRIGRGVELSDAGRDLLTTAQSALETVRQGVWRLESYSKPGTVILHMLPHIALPWFLPRLPAFRADFPDIDPWLVTTNEAPNLMESEFDISLRTTPPRDEDGEVGRLFLRETRVPFAAPAQAAAFRNQPQDAVLIHDESPDDWQRWFAVAGIWRDRFAEGLNFSDNAMALEAAARGLGACLGDPVLAASWLQDGRLEIAHEARLASNQSYFLVSLERNLQRPAVRTLWEWLTAQAAVSA